MNQPGPGILLIAEPFLKDPNFMRTVVLLCEHQDEGSFGFVLNRDFKHTLDELVPDLEDVKLPVCYGGPVQMDTLHFLHQCPDQIPGGFEIRDGIFWGGDFETVVDLLRNHEIDTAKIRFYIGYSGWGGGQLKDELNEKSWLLAEASKKLVFHKKLDDIWKDSLKLLGREYEMMKNFPIDPQLN